MQKFCASCGSRLIYSAKFCIYCGKKIQTEVLDNFNSNIDFKNNNEKYSPPVLNILSEGETENIMAEIVNMCEIDPDAGLEFIDKTIKENPEIKNNPFGKFARAMAFGSKGLFQLSCRRPDVNFSVFEEDELRTILGVNDTHLDYLEKGLNEIRLMEEIFPNALEKLGAEEYKLGEKKIDAMALVLERCRPGRVQQILGKTKLLFFGHSRILTVGNFKVNELSKNIFMRVRNIFFTFNSIVRTAIVLEEGPSFIRFLMCERTPDNPTSFSENVSEKYVGRGILSIFDNGNSTSDYPLQKCLRCNKPTFGIDLKNGICCGCIG